jgi:hypothetical protein
MRRVAYIVVTVVVPCSSEDPMLVVLKSIHKPRRRRLKQMISELEASKGHT